MAGKNKILKPGQVLFQEGDKSDGMYVVRRGRLQVYLENNGNEIPLAQVAAGSMLGEMALFDKRPRSASARAVDDVEVTHIKYDDFSKILNQIPKWFVTLMASLSERLRDTNEKLQQLEDQHQGSVNPLEQLSRVLHILNLLYYKFGEKEVKSWALERKLAEEQISMILDITVAHIAKITQNLVEGGLINLGKNRYKADVYVVHNRGMIERFNDFVQRIRSVNPSMRTIPHELADIADTLERLSQRSAYTSLTIKLEDLLTEAESLSMRTTRWHEYFDFIGKIDPDCIEVKKVSGKYAFKVNKKQISKFLQNCRILIALTQGSGKPTHKDAA